MHSLRPSVGAALLALSLGLAACATGEDTNNNRETGVARDANSGSGDSASDATLDAGTEDAADSGAADSGSGGGDGSADATQRDGSSGDATDGAPADRPDVCVPTTEVCNGLDDNCDGRIDESGCPGHLLLTEVVAQPNAAEFIEIYNPTSAPINLSNLYLTDTSEYPRTFSSSMPAMLDASDFVARFPDGATIGPGEYQTIATGNPGGWATIYGLACPTYYLQSSATLGRCSSARVMRPMPGVASSIGMTASLTNTGEPVMLFQWDGASDLVQDVDYVYFGMWTMMGTSYVNPPVDKSMLSVDGPDPDSAPTGYRLDTPFNRQTQAPLAALGGSQIRCDLREGTETLNGGNGVTGHNETSEDFSMTWRATTPPDAGADGGASTFNATPNAANPCM